MRRRRHGYLFTSKKPSLRAQISVILGLISVLSTGFIVIQTYENGGQANLQDGAVVFVCLIFSMAGLILSILSRREPDKLYVFSYIGMVLNGLAVAFCFVIMYLGLL